MTQSILVVDDSATVRRVVGRTLSQAGYDVSLATDGREAIELAQRKVPDLVLVDFVMPQMNGGDAFRAMRRIVPDLKVVIMSGHSPDRQPQEILQEPGTAFLAKPFDLDTLNAAIARVSRSRLGSFALSRARRKSCLRSTSSARASR